MKRLFIISVSIMVLTSCNSKVGIQADETNQNCEANTISVASLAELIYSKDITDVQFIDIRTPHQFAMGHLPNAINIPSKNFLDKERFEEINKDNMLILYGADTSSPKMLALLASHFNKGSFYTALGGYKMIKEKIIDDFGLHSGAFDDEIPIVDFQKAINEIKNKAGVVSTSIKTKKNPSSKPIIKRKKKEVSGGCG